MNNRIEEVKKIFSDKFDFKNLSDRDTIILLYDWWFIPRSKIIIGKAKLICHLELERFKMDNIPPDWLDKASGFLVRCATDNEKEMHFAWKPNSEFMN